MNTALSGAYIWTYKAENPHQSSPANRATPAHVKLFTYDKLHRIKLWQYLSLECGCLPLGKKGKKKEKLPDAPFRLTSDELRVADKRAVNVQVPVGYG